MVEQNISQEFRLKNIDETKNYLIEEIEESKSMGKKGKKGFYYSKLYWTLSYFSVFSYWMYFHFWICFFSQYSVAITSSATELKNCAITAGIKKYKSIIKKKKKTHDKIVLLPKTKLTSMKVLIYIKSISHDGFVLINNALKEYDDLKEKINNLKTS